MKLSTLGYDLPMLSGYEKVSFPHLHLVFFLLRVNKQEEPEFSKVFTLIVSTFSLRMFHVAGTNFLLRSFKKDFIAMQNLIQMRKTGIFRTGLHW